MAINIQNLSAEEKAIQAKYIQIGNGLLPEAIAKVEELYPSVANVWEHKYLIINEMLLTIGYDKIGAWLSKNEVMMYLRQACAYESKNNNNKEGIVKDLPYAFAHILMVRKANAELLTELYKDKMVSEAQIERVKAARDRIAMKVNIDADGVKINKHVNAASEKQMPRQRQTDPEITAAIRNASKPDTVYNFKAVVSSLQEEGLSIEMKDGLAHVFVEAESGRVDAGIIRPGSIVADLTALDQKCLSLGKGINLSIVINKAGGSSDEVSKEEDVMTEDEVLYDNIRSLLEDNLAEVEKRGQNVIITGDTGHMAILITGTMIEFGRILYSRCGEIFNEEHTAEIRKGLEDLFGTSKTKQETSRSAESESVENNLTDDEESLVSEGTSATVDIVFDVELPDGRLVKVTRRTSVKQDDKDPNFLYGYIYRDGKYVGSWIWNRKYSLPVYKPQQVMKKTALGERNSRRLCAAIKKAVCGK